MPHSTPTLDVRTMPAARRHAEIFSTFDTLAVSGGFVLLSDHDPKPLLYQFQAKCPGQFDWYVMEAGPDRFRVEIRRRASNTSRTVTEYLEDDHRRLDALLADVARLADSGTHAEALIRFREFACGLNRHIDAEEQVLFPAFERMTGAVSGPTVVMRAEHLEIRRCIERAATVLEEQDATLAMDAVEALTEVLSLHNMKEEQILYPMTDRAVSALERENLVRQMQAF